MQRIDRCFVVAGATMITVIDSSQLVESGSERSRDVTSTTNLKLTLDSSQMGTR